VHSSLATLGDRELLKLYHERGDATAREELVNRHLPLVKSLARRYAGRGEALEDIEQVGAIGLIKAIDRYELSREVALTTYATPNVVGEIKRHFRDTCWAIHLPRSLQERVLKVEQAERELSGRVGRAPTVAELAEHAHITEEEALEALEAASAFDTRSLDAPAPADDDEGRSHVETIGDVDEGFGLVEDLGAVRVAMRSLPARERRILHMRFMGDMTQSEIAKRIGVSQMQISRLIRRALRTLRDEAEAEPRVEVTAA
jgi:RNA polymerase sigma-B factor